MTEQAAQPKQPTKPQADRIPIPIEKLLFSAANPHGVKLPEGDLGQTDRITHQVIAGLIDNGRVKIEIDHRPWMRVFRVTKLKRNTRTEKGQEVVDWIPMGKPFHIPDTWAVSIPADE